MRFNHFVICVGIAGFCWVALGDFALAAKSESQLLPPPHLAVFVFIIIFF